MLAFLPSIITASFCSQVFPCEKATLERRKERTKNLNSIFAQPNSGMKSRLSLQNETRLVLLQGTGQRSLILTVLFPCPLLPGASRDVRNNMSIHFLEIGLASAGQCKVKQCNRRSL